MRKLYFCPFVLTSLMLASGALLAQVNISTTVLSFVGATRFNPGEPGDVPSNQVVQSPDVDVSFGCAFDLSTSPFYSVGPGIISRNRGYYG